MQIILLMSKSQSLLHCRRKLKVKQYRIINSWLLIFDKLFYFIAYMSFSKNPEREALIYLRSNTCILGVILEITLHFVN